ncbi:hypothetical protein KC357_g228 [Hortaea werneckii]|nr:hypothetical protein KC357_g228 [Hortaea werneckii]
MDFFSVGSRDRGNGDLTFGPSFLSLLKAAITPSPTSSSLFFLFLAGGAVDASAFSAVLLGGIAGAVIASAIASSSSAIPSSSSSIMKGTRSAILAGGLASASLLPNAALCSPSTTPSPSSSTPSSLVTPLLNVASLETGWSQTARPTPPHPSCSPPAASSQNPPADRYTPSTDAAGSPRARPQDQRDLVDQTGLGELLQTLLVVRDVDHAEHEAQVVFPLQRFDPRVDVLRVQAVVLQAEEETAGRQAQEVVGGDVAVWILGLERWLWRMRLDERADGVVVGRHLGFRRP